MQGDASGLRPLLERQLEAGFPWLRFEKPLEDLFSAYLSVNRMRLGTLWCAFGLVVYDLMLISERFTLADQYHTMQFCRIGIFTPLCLFWIYVFRRRPTIGVYEAAGLSTCVLGVLMPMVVMMFSASPHRLTYQTGSVMTMLYFAILLRPRFRTMATGVALMAVIQLVTCKYSGAFDDIIYASIVWFYAPIVVFIVLSAYLLERSERSNFLSHLLNDCLHGELERQARLDALTGLENRRSLLAFEQDRPSSSAFAFMIDIDHFKRFNDSQGHLRGDECIRDVAAAVRESVGDAGRVFRYGGEEMLVVLPDADLYAAFDRAESVRRAVARLAIPHPAMGPDAKVTVSLGLAAADLGRTPLAELIAEADKALYQAKAAGRDRIWPALDLGLGAHAEAAPAAVAGG